MRLTHSVHSGAFWTSLAITLTPSYNATGAYLATAKTVAEEEAGRAEFYSSFGECIGVADHVVLTGLPAYLPLFLGLLTAIFTVCALRTNTIFVFMFFMVTITAELLAGAYWCLADGRVKLGGNLTKVSQSPQPAVGPIDRIRLGRWRMSLCPLFTWMVSALCPTIASGRLSDLTSGWRPKYTNQGRI